MRRRKPKVVWLPLTNANDIGAPGDITSTVYNAFIVPVSGTTGDVQTTEIPIVLDSPQTAASATDSSLADIESSGYRLRRIVGKIWCVYNQSDLTGGGTGTNDGPATIIVTAGFIIRRVDSNGVSLESLSVGGAQGTSPAISENNGDPWIWRRSWLLGDRYNVTNLQPAITVGVQPTVITEWPQNNFYGYAGGNSDGPHVDQKTARIVAQEERLFLDVSATTLLQGTNTFLFSQLSVFTDLRILGTLRANLGNRRNASR